MHNGLCAYFFLKESVDVGMQPFFFVIVPHVMAYRVPTRALISCCAVARAQHLGQNSRFAQQPPIGWLRAAQHAIFGAQHFRRRRKFFVAAFFFRRRREKKKAYFL